jgi:hypothetical protein
MRRLGNYLIRINDDSDINNDGAGGAVFVCGHA